MKDTLYIIGASGYGKVVADIAKLNGYKNIFFLDDDKTKKTCGRYSVIGTSNDVGNGDVIVAIGDARTRRKISERYKDKLATLIHPETVIADDVKIGAGSVVMAGVIVNPGTVIGDGCIINTGATVDHDNVIGNYCHISVGSHLAGTVHIGDETWIGVGAVVSNNVNICGFCMIGAGAVVIKDIEVPGTYVGVPARQMENSMNSLKTNRGGGRQTNKLTVPSYGMRRWAA